MKKVLFGGMLFIGGSIMYSVGVLGFADVAVQAGYMQVPQYAGLLSIVIGIVLGVFGLKED
ncbi:hypothetical protein [Natronincola ferrireducens]|uniref:Uncharacterized protein n=1 Tax=Natronincola ferrireducens TaxID=393762 RepID=A0A1G8Z8K2_9FIRM|nr:hypothetical protein [Natronincola ferrireducens]SDK11402.1 hypothetical protein SAMN05660472_00772 [Natronincola ferrireducens]